MEENSQVYKNGLSMFIKDLFKTVLFNFFQMDHLRTVSQMEEEVHSSEIESLQEDISDLVQNINKFILNETKNSISASGNCISFQTLFQIRFVNQRLHILVAEALNFLPFFWIRVYWYLFCSSLPCMYVVKSLIEVSQARQRLLPHQR